MSEFQVMDGRRLSRRHVLGAAMFLSGLAAPGLVLAQAQGSSPIVDTAQGKLQGTVKDGVFAFRGVPYGADTSGRNRFLPPRPVKPWTGVRPAVSLGSIAPQFGDGPMSEDCLVLNVWTPTLSKGARRPVMVWFHGGGFATGSANSAGLDGDHLARFGDCVVVTLNHRLSAFGYLNLRDLGAPAEFADAGANGLLDGVAALRWVRENIEGFGGDPNRVLAFGQSGGGRKVSVLMGMPGAKGLFQRAGVMSGAMPRVLTPDGGAKVADQLLHKLGLKASQIAELQALPMSAILAAQLSFEAAPRAGGEDPRIFNPVIGGPALPKQPFDPEASPLSRDVPMVSSTTLDERSYRLNNFDLDEAGFRKFAASRSGEARADAAVAMYRAEDPGGTPYLLQARLDTDTDHRSRSFFILESKLRQGGAPVYSYLWKKPTIRFNGRGGAFHAIDVGPTFRNLNPTAIGDGPPEIALSDQVASFWVAFAATGDPNNPRLPKLAPYDLKDRTTLIYDRNTTVERDPRRQFREFWASRHYPVDGD